MKNFHLWFLSAMFATSIICANTAVSKSDWWQKRGVTDESLVRYSAAGSRDDGAASMGQLKYVAGKAAEELDDKLHSIGGKGEAVKAALENLDGASDETSGADNAPVDYGTLKDAAKPFFDRLFEVRQLNPDFVDMQGIKLLSGGTEAMKKYPWNDGGEYDAYPAAMDDLEQMFSWKLNGDAELSDASIEKGERGNHSGKSLKGLGVENDRLDYERFYRELSLQALGVGNPEFDGDASLNLAADEDMDKDKVKSIYALTQAVPLDLYWSSNSAQTDGISTIWNLPEPGNYGSYPVAYLKLGKEYVVENCWWVSHSPGSMLAGRCSCETTCPQRKAFTFIGGVQPKVWYYKRSHTCSGAVGGLPQTTYGPAFEVNELAEGSHKWTQHGPSSNHTSIICGTSFEPWVWDIKISEQQSKTINFGRGFRTEDNPRGNRTIKVDYSSSAITAVIEYGNFSLEKKSLADGQVEITITPDSVAGKYEGALYLETWDPIRHHQVRYLLRHEGDAAMPLTFPLTESSGPKYRKVSLTGRPINDDKPQAQEESDFVAPETYVDALSQALRHGVNDYVQQVPTSDLVLSVRRNYAHESWNEKSGLRPDERRDLPFGLGWSSNIVSYVQMENMRFSNAYDRTEPDSVTVVDENGMPFRFAIGAPDQFLPMPNDRSDAQAFLNTLERDADGNLVFKKRYGTTLKFKPSGIPALIIEHDRITHLAQSSTAYTYYRLDEASDRYGNKVKYEYSDSAANRLVPSRIWAVMPTGAAGMSISIEQDGNGLVKKVTCPQGLELNYTYETKSLGMVNFPVLKTVRKGDASRPNVFSYDYVLDTEKNVFWEALPLESKYQYNYYHIDLKSILDGAGNEYAFGYKERVAHFVTPEGEGNDDGGGVYSRQNNTYYVPSGGAGKVSGVTIKQNGEVFSSAVFDEYTKVMFITIDGSGLYAKKNLMVTDGAGNKVKYTWADPDRQDKYPVVMDAIDSFKEIYGFGPDDEGFSSPSMVYYKRMSIEYFDPGGASLGEESVTFDVSTGMAISSSTDISGNTTTFEYNDEVPGIVKNELYYARKFPDPTSQTDAFGNVTEFTYDAATRVMTSVKKISSSETTLGGCVRETTWTVDSLGRRTGELVYNYTGSYGMKETVNEYLHDGLANFLTKSTIKNGGGNGVDIVTTYVPDQYGNVAVKTTSAGSENYAYGANGAMLWQEDANGNRTNYLYDNSLKRLMRVTNPDGTAKSFTYDAIGRKLSETNENGNATSYEYNALHKVVKTAQPLGVVTHTVYNAVGMPSKVIDPNGNATEIEYDGLLRPVKKTQYSGETAMGVTTYEYGANSGSNLFSTSDFKPVRTTNTKGYVSEFTYDALYRLTESDEEYAKETDDVSSYSGDGVKTTLYAYDVFGNKTSETDDNGNTTLYEYNVHDLPSKITFADGSFKFSQYTAAGMMFRDTDEMENSTEYKYDTAGRLVQKTYPMILDEDTEAKLYPIEYFAYDAAGNVTAHTDPNGNVTNFEYDSRNRRVREMGPSVRVGGTETFARPTTVTTYDGVGNKTSVTDPNGNTTSFEYDALNRLVKTTYPLVKWYRRDVNENFTEALTELLAYDANGNVIESTDKRGVKTITTYNYLNKPVEVLVAFEMNKKTDAYEYDTEGNLIKITGIGNVVTEYEYDGLNRRKYALYCATAATESNRKGKWYIYDGVNLAKEMPACIDYSYDSRNRLLRRSTTYNGINAAYNYAYDACSRITSVTAGTGAPSPSDVFYEYNALGRLTYESSNGIRHKYRYDLAGNEISAKYGFVVIDDSDYWNPVVSVIFSRETAYDSNNRVVSVTDNDGRVTSYGYDLCGNMVSQDYPNGVKTVCEYDSYNRLAQKTLTKDGTELAKGEYGYSQDGSAAVINQYCGGKWQKIFCMYSDIFCRLTNEKITYDDGSKSSKDIRYADRSMSTVNGSKYNASTGGYESAYRRYYYGGNTDMVGLLEVGGRNNSTMEYDDLGNASHIYYPGRYEHPSTTLIQDGDDERLVYDGFGRLVSYVKAKQEDIDSPYFSASYTYDYRNRRVSYSKGTDLLTTPAHTTTNYYYSGGTSVIESDGTTETRFYRGPDMGGGVGGILYACNADGTGLNYKHYNLRGDVIVTTDDAGNVLSQSHYETYGEHADYGAMPSDKHRANTKVEDADTSLLLEGHRYRLLGAGIFLSPDPLEYVDGLHRYAYCGFNPWGRFDPTGLMSDKYIKMSFNSQHNNNTATVYSCSLIFLLEIGIRR